MEKIKVEFCTGTACHLMGAHELKEYLTTLPLDMKSSIEISGSTCLGQCGKGPNVKVNGVIHSNMTIEKLEEIIQDILRQENKKS